MSLLCILSIFKEHIKKWVYYGFTHIIPSISQVYPTFGVLSRFILTTWAVVGSTTGAPWLAAGIIQGTQQQREDVLVMSLFVHRVLVSLEVTQNNGSGHLEMFVLH